MRYTRNPPPRTRNPKPKDGLQGPAMGPLCRNQQPATNTKKKGRKSSKSPIFAIFK